MVLGGHEDDRLVLRLHHAPEQVEQHGWFVVPAHVEESQLQGEGRAQPLCVPTSDTATPCPLLACLEPPQGGLQGVGGTKPISSPLGPSHLELLAELGLHIQTDQHGLGATCGMW